MIKPDGGAAQRVRHDLVGDGPIHPVRVDVEPAQDAGPVDERSSDRVVACPLQPVVADTVGQPVLVGLHDFDHVVAEQLVRFALGQPGVAGAGVRVLAHLADEGLRIGKCATEFAPGGGVAHDDAVPVEVQLGRRDLLERAEEGHRDLEVVQSLQRHLPG